MKSRYSRAGKLIAIDSFTTALWCLYLKDTTPIKLSQALGIK